MVMMMRRSLEMGSLSFNQQTNSGIMGDHHHHPPLDSNFIPYSDDISSSSESDSMEDGSSSGSSSPISPKGESENGPLGDLSSLLQQLPFKRGLSKHFNGKSQSFGSLSNVTCLEDLAKPENPYYKKLKYSKSYMGLSAAAATLNKSASSKLISKKSSSTRASCSSVGGKRNGSNSMRPPTHPPVPHRSNSTACISNRTPLFA